jgi:hypothetical protein
MLDQTGETLRYLLHAAEAIMKNPANYDDRVERYSPSNNVTRTILEKYIYQGSAIRYNPNCVYKDGHTADI